MHSTRWTRTGAIATTMIWWALAGCGSSTTAQPTTANAAQTAENADPEAEQHRHNQAGGMAMLIHMSSKELDLSAEQKDAVQKIRADLHAKTEPVRAAGKNLSGVLADGVAAGSVDRAKADAAIAQLATASSGLHDATADALNQLHKTLTPAQRAALIDKIHGHFEKWKDAHGRDDQASDPRRGHGAQLGMLGKEIALTPEQTEKIKASLATGAKAAPQTHEHKEVHEHMQSFATAFKSDTFDARTLGAGATGANAHMATWGATRMARFFEAAAPVLTPEQRTKLAERIRRHSGDPKP